MRYTYKLKKTCSTQVSFDLDGDVIRNVEFEDGCEGNLKAIQALVEGLTVQELQARCSGITCGRKSTSCADQLTQAVFKALEERA